MNLTLTGIEGLNDLPQGDGVLFPTIKWKWSGHVEGAEPSMELCFPNPCKDTGLWDVTILQLTVELGLLAVSPRWLKEKPTAGERTARITHQPFSVAIPKLDVYSRTSTLGPTCSRRQ